MTERRLFVAGSTGATGQVLCALAERRGIAFVAHRRPATAAKLPPDPRAAVLELADRPALVAALRGCTTVLQLVGTTRRRFSRGDTYDTSDIGTTRQLVEAAREAGVDHFLLLSSVGAGRPAGAYLRAKAQAEALVTGGGLAWTIFRPSMLVGGERRAPPGMKAVTRLLHLRSLEPISLEDLSAAMLRCALDRSPLGQVVEGATLWDLVRQAAAA